MVLQDNICLCQGRVWSTSGSLVLWKCSWSLLSYHHQGTWWLLHSATSMPVELLVLDTTGNPTPIKCLFGLEVVGIAQSLMGMAALILATLQKKTDKWLESLCSNFLPCHLIWTTVHHILWPPICYPLSVTSLSPSQAASTFTSLYQILLKPSRCQPPFPYYTLIHSSPLPWTWSTKPLLGARD